MPPLEALGYALLYAYAALGLGYWLRRVVESYGRGQ